MITNLTDPALLSSSIGSGTGTSTGSGSGSGTSGCSGVTGQGATAIVQEAINYAWPTYHDSPYIVFKPTYQAAVKAAVAAGVYVGGGSGVYQGIDCGGFVNLVMRNSGADPNYDSGNGDTIVQEAYLNAHPELYEDLGPQTNSLKLLPGDIAINSDHTFIYVGSQPNFDGDSASASYSTTGLSWRTPMADGFDYSDSAGPFIWYRLIQ
jgi:hypothetical protein